MTEDFIQLKKDNLLRLKIRTDEGKYTGEELVFDLEDIELPLRLQDMMEADKKNKLWLKNQISIIEKRQDVKGKKLYSKNQEDKYRALQDFFKKEAEIYDMFLGENGVKKLLNGRKLGWTTLTEIDEIIEKFILPKVNVQMNDITKKVKEKYKEVLDKDKSVLTLDNVKDGIYNQFTSDVNE